MVEDLQEGKLDVLCSRLVLAEFVAVLHKLNRTQAKGFKLEVSHLTEGLIDLVPHWMDLDDSVLLRAADYAYRVNPSDYTHIATMELNGVQDVLSADRDLDHVPWLRRTDPRGYRGPRTD